MTRRGWIDTVVGDGEWDAGRLGIDASIGCCSLDFTRVVNCDADGLACTSGEVDGSFDVEEDFGVDVDVDVDVEEDFGVGVGVDGGGCFCTCARPGSTRNI